MQPDTDVKPNYAYFPILVEKDAYGMDRNDLYNMFLKNGICPRKYFYPLINEYDCYEDRYDPDATPVAKDISNKVLTLPLYASLDMDTVNRICDIIALKQDG